MGKHSQGKSISSRRAARAEAAAAQSGGRPRTSTSRTPSAEGNLSANLQHQRRNRRLKRAAAITAIVLVVVAAGIAAQAYRFMRSVESEMQVAPEKQPALAKVLKKPEPQKPFNVLLLGADVRPKETVWRSDTIIVARIDPEAKTVRMISIPRDTRAQIPGYGVSKINHGRSAGGDEAGPETMVKTVEQFLGVPINHYAEVDFKGFQKAVDAMGGVWIDVDTEIDDWKAASHSPGHRAQHVDKGYQLLDGEHALTYVRSRDFPDGDFTRIAHQQTFFKALADQVAKGANVWKLPSVIKSIAPYIQTDMSASQMIKVAQALRTAGSKNLDVATIEGEWRTPYVWPDEEHKARVVANFKAGRSLDATPPLSELAPADITVAVRNGAGIGGAARAAGGELENEGYNVVEIADADSSDYERTLVVYDGGNKVLAEKVAGALPVGAVTDGKGAYSFDSRVLVVIGKDWKQPPN